MKKNGKCKKVYLELKKQIEDYLKYKRVFDKVIPFQKPLNTLVLYTIDGEGNLSSSESNYSDGDDDDDNDRDIAIRRRRRRFKNKDESESEESNNSTIS